VFIEWKGIALISAIMQIPRSSLRRAGAPSLALPHHRCNCPMRIMRSRGAPARTRRNGSSDAGEPTRIASLVQARPAAAPARAAASHLAGGARPLLSSITYPPLLPSSSLFGAARRGMARPLHTSSAYTGKEIAVARARARASRSSRLTRDRSSSLSLFEDRYDA